MVNANQKTVEFMSNYITVADISAAKAIAKISAYICRYRKENGFSQKDFAKFMGVTQSMISKWESGEYNFTVESIAKIAEKMKVTFDIEFNEKDQYIYRNRENYYEIRRCTAAPAKRTSASLVA